MNIGGIRASSLIDYPGKLAAVIFFNGCNFKCPYCHNYWLLDKKNNPLSIHDIFCFLKKRISKLDAVVFSGGEPTIQKGLLTFIRKIKDMGFYIKLDTNGHKPDVIAELLEQNILDYIAMDIKGPFAKYNKIANQKINIDNIKQSIDLIKKSKIKYEFRTTLVRSLLTEKDILNCGNIIKGAQAYYLQKFNSDNVFDKKFKKESTYSDKELEIITKKLKLFVNRCDFR